MTTDALAEDLTVEAFALVRGPANTSTSVDNETAEGVEAAVELMSEGDAVSWDLLDAPPRFSRIGMAAYDFAKAVWAIPGVIAVTHATDRGVNLIWSFIEKRNKVTRKQIYDRERALMTVYPDLTFNFNVGALDQGASASCLSELESKIVMYRLPGL